MERIHRSVLGVLAAVLSITLAPGPRTEAQVVNGCPEDLLPDLQGLQVLEPAERVFLDEFGEALTRFQDMPLDEFRAEFSPGKDYLRTARGFTRGEANGDAAIDLSDAVCILRALFLGEGSCGSASCLDSQDTDDSGRVDITDAVFLLNHLFLGGPAPPAPWPGSGVDPTFDDLPCANGPGLGYEPMEAEYLERVLSRYFISEAQEATFRENGFVILENVKYDTFFHGFHEAWIRDLPIYISADAILDTLSLSMDRILLAIEEAELIDQLFNMLAKMEAGLGRLAAHGNGIDIETNLDDAAAWVCVARSLLEGSKVPCSRATNAVVSELLARIATEDLQKLTLFGEIRCEDFSQFKVRGHYTRSERLSRYFRAMMWIQRTGLKIVQSERQASLAFLLTRLLQDTGAIEHWTAIDTVVKELVGASDSANPPAFASFIETHDVDLPQLRDPEGFQGFVRTALLEGLGKQRINGQILMQMRDLSPGIDYTPIPPAFHVMGQRFVIDSFVFQNVTWDRVCRRGWARPCPLFGDCPFADGCGRTRPSPLDAWFVLGNRAALPLLEKEIQTWDYHANLAALEWLVGSHSPDFWAERGLAEGGGAAAEPGSIYSRDFWSENLYNVWLSLLRDLAADTTAPEYPPAMRTEAWDRRMLQVQLASWSQLRHSMILYPKPSTGTGEGCDYPHGWVDPYPVVYEKLAELAARMRGRLQALNLGLDLIRMPECDVCLVDVGGYLANLEEVGTQLAAIARAELAGDSLGTEQHEFVRSLLYEHGSYGVAERVFNGWYPRLIFGFDAVKADDFNPFIADVHTEPNRGEVLHVATGYPNLMLLTVQNDCGTRAYAGPVFSYHEFFLGSPEDPFIRWNDEEWKAELESGVPQPRPPWTGQFVR